MSRHQKRYLTLIFAPPLTPAPGASVPACPPRDATAEVFNDWMVVGHFAIQWFPVMARRYTWEVGLGLGSKSEMGLGLGQGLELTLILTLILTPNLTLILTYANHFPNSPF